MWFKTVVVVSFPPGGIDNIWVWLLLMLAAMSAFIVAVI